MTATFFMKKVAIMKLDHNLTDMLIYPQIHTPIDFLYRCSYFESKEKVILVEEKLRRKNHDNKYYKYASIA